MNILLKSFFVVELLIGYPWLVITYKPNIMALFLFIYTFPIHLIFMIVSIWSVKKKPETKKMGLLVFFTPILFFILPRLLNSILANVDYSEQMLYTYPALLFLLLCLPFPKLKIIWVFLFLVYIIAWLGLIFIFTYIPIGLD